MSEPSWVEDARELREQGWTYKDIAAAMQRHVSTVKDWLIPGMRERRRARTAVWQKKNREQTLLLSAKANAKKGNYLAPAITAEAMELLRQNHNGCCEKCGIYFGVEVLRPDHCHKTGKQRGLLCHGCNVGIGLLGDDLAGLQQAVKYMEKYST